MKRSFFQTAVVSILLYGCTTWTVTKQLEKKLDGNYSRMLRAILNKSWRQHPTRHQLYGHLPPITKIIQVRRTKHAGHCWRSRDELISDVLLWTPAYGRAKAGDQLEHTYSSNVRIRDVALTTSRRRWTIGRNGERWSGVSVLAARHDDDDDEVFLVILTCCWDWICNFYIISPRRIFQPKVLSSAPCVLGRKFSVKFWDLYPLCLYQLIRYFSPRLYKMFSFTQARIAIFL